MPRNQGPSSMMKADIWAIMKGSPFIRQANDEVLVLQPAAGSMFNKYNLPPILSSLEQKSPFVAVSVMLQI